MKESKIVDFIYVNGKPIGFKLSEDHEYKLHESGLKEMKSLFKYDLRSIKEMVYRYKKSIFKKYFWKGIHTGIRTNKKSGVLDTLHNRRHYLFIKNKKEFLDISFDINKDIFGAWNNKGFIVGGSHSNIQKTIKDLTKAEKQKDLFIGFIPEIANGYLLILIASKIPDYIKKKIKENEELLVKAYIKMYDSKIEDLLRKNFKQYSVLKPKLLTKDLLYENRMYLKGSLVYWLKPVNGDWYKTGYFSDKEIEMWCYGLGPVVK